MNFKTLETSQKLRGGYYTPKILSDFIVKWVISENPSHILEPSCGDGVFLSSLLDENYTGKVTAFELDPIEAGKAREIGLSMASCNVHNTDFMGWAIDNIFTNKIKFDAIIGNPPFIRYQYLPKEFQDKSEIIFNNLGCKFTKHTNAWVPFVLSCIEALQSNGKLAMVIPSEIFHVLHANELRTFISKNCSQYVIIDPQELWFQDTLQGAVILMAQKKNNISDETKGLGVFYAASRAFLSVNPDKLFEDQYFFKPSDLGNKWTKALLKQDAFKLLSSIEKLDSVYRFKEVAKVDVGIVTGANNFFLVDDQTVEMFNLHNVAHPMFGRSDHCNGVIYDTEQHTSNALKGKPTNFLWFKKNDVINDEAILEYIEKGVLENLHKRYKCSVRNPWYCVPSVYSTKVGMLKRSHDTPRLIYNEIGAYTTDTAYRITTDSYDPENLVGVFMNPLTALSAELEGRYYGGGVLELVPSEIEKLLIPDPKLYNEDLRQLDMLVRTHSVEDVLSKNGSKTLSLLGLNDNERSLLLDEWSRLRNRRQRNPI